MEKFQKAPIVYQGNKFRLLKKIRPLMPKEIEIFVDLFGGSSAMSLNVGKKAIYNELNPFLKEMIEMIYKYKAMPDKVDELIVKWDLKHDLSTPDGSQKMQDSYYPFRDWVNSLEYGTTDHIIGVYTLHIFAINNLIRFNKDGGFNASAGFRLGNTHPTRKLRDFKPRPKEEIAFTCEDFESIVDKCLSSKAEGLFFYADPPYLNTTAVYNENRLTGWDIESDYRLFKTLDRINSNGYKFALSNTLVGKNGETNTHLKEWAEKNGYKINYLNHSYASFGKSNQKNVEVLITNYDMEEENATHAN